MPVRRSATRERHPSRATVRRRRPREAGPLVIPLEENELELELGDRTVHLTNLKKVYWPGEGITKGQLLQYYADVAPVLLPHLVDRAMVMKRYPSGIEGPFFFMKRAPMPRPEWLDLCTIEHASGNVIDFPVIQDLAALLWVVNLGCIDLNPWYARCGDVDTPDFLHFDLDPVPGADFEKVCQAALILHQALDELQMPNYAKTTGSRGIHVYVPIVRGPTQKEVWNFSKAFARLMEKRAPDLLTTVYRVADRPPGHVLVDYNQNAWGRTLASVYSVRPKPRAPVSMPVTWEEIERGIRIEDFRIDNAPQRLRELGDLWRPLLEPEGRFDLERFA